MEITGIVIRPADFTDTNRVQEIRKLAWQARYVNPETGVTKDLLKNKLAKFPPSEGDIKHFKKMLDKKANKDKNLVATIDGRIIGTVFYDELVSGAGDIGVFVDEEFNGKGVGAKLLDTLIAKTNNDLEVTIFAKNPSRKFYKEHGFVEAGPEDNHYFSKEVYLPIQRLVLSRK